LATDFLAEVFFAADFFAAGLRAVVFLAADFLTAATRVDAGSSSACFLAAATLAFSASIRSTTFAVGSASTTSISSPLTFASTIVSSASRYSSVNSSGFHSAVRFSISWRAISTSCPRAFELTSASPNSASRISSGQYIVSSTNASSLNRSAARCSLSRKLTLAMPTLLSWLIASRSSA
jgi:hypothetical protein